MTDCSDATQGGLAGEETLAWLLEPANPCVRWRTLRELLGRPDSDGEVQAAAEDVYRWPPVVRLLQVLADPQGYAWPAGIRPVQFARPGRDLCQLVRVGVPPGHPELRRAAIGMKGDLPDNRSSDCYLPQMVAALVRYGDPDDPDVPRLVHRVVDNELLADGNRPPTGGGGSCCISHSCHNAVARALDCVAGVPEPRRTPQMARFLERGVGYLAAHRRLLLKNHHKPTPIRSEYSKLRQPWGLDWLTDVLDLLDISTRMGMADHPAPALKLLIGKRLPDGRWPLETVYRTDRPLIANLLRDIEPVGAPGKWVTLTALLMLRRCSGLVARIEAGEVFPAAAEEPPASFAPYPWRRSAADEKATRAEWGDFEGMPAVLEALLQFAEQEGLGTGWYRGLAMGPKSCREWCCSRAKPVPARNIKVAFPVARTMFLAPRGMFTVESLCGRLGGGPVHEYAGRLRPGSWVEKALWRVRVGPWTPLWDTVGIAIAGVAEMERVLPIMHEALAGFREGPARVR